MIGGVLTLFKTLVEIALLRKGPDALPHSSVLLLIVAAIWIAVGAIGAMIVDTYNGQALLADLILTALGFGLYAVVVKVFERSERLLRALTAILGCGAMFGVALFAGRYVLTTFLAVEEAPLFSELILMWSILVEGHIIARTIDRQWVIGFLIALAVLIGQLQMFAVLKPMLESAT
jgi:hypothetical protein